MKIHELATTSKPTRKRVGRGISAGGGKTAGRGTKGQNSRTGGGVILGFEGGQTKLSRRLPKKRGFTALAKPTVEIVNVGDLEVLKKATIDAKALADAGLVSSEKSSIKLLGDGDLQTKLSIQVTAASKSAIAKVEAAGGSVKITTTEAVTKPKTDKTKPSQT